MHQFEPRYRSTRDERVRRHVAEAHRLRREERDGVWRSRIALAANFFRPQKRRELRERLVES
jgi:hypothetical protein